jgi:hypothetical protein
MQKKLKLAVIALCCTSAAFAQTPTGQQPKENNPADDEQAFTFTEAQLGEDDDMSQNVTIINSNSNLYASQVGYLFSPVRFRYRAFNQKYNEIYINGAPMNDMESGQFRYSMIGGLNPQTRNVEFALPFEANNFSMSAMGGSNNYNFRPSSQPVGNRVTLSGANRNYTLRAGYTYNSGLSEKGWAYSAAVMYRWANRGYVEGTFYNSLSYFLGVEKVFNDQHSLSLVTWGNPTERASQGAATDEAYWLANDRYYNPYWGYQNGKKRNSRVVNDFAPTALLTWDWKINDYMKLTTALTGKYSHYKSTKLNYSNSDNPHPNYWKNLPSSFYDVWDETDATNRTDQNLADWQSSYEFWTASKANRQINWDRLYYSNQQLAAQGKDAMYYIQAKNNDQLMLTLSSALKMDLTKTSALNLGFNLQTTKGMHYQTMEDLLGATVFHNINTYALGTYAGSSNEVQYDLNNPNGEVREGDKFGYNYNLLVDKANVWATYKNDFNQIHTFLSGRVGATSMQRDGKMRNGLAADNSYGKSGTARFLDGGVKAGATFSDGPFTMTWGLGYELRTPTASTAFVSPEINNDFVNNLKNEKVFSAELGYYFKFPWINISLNGYYSHITDGTEWQNFYYDDINSFSYVSFTGVKKEYYGAELGANIKINSAFSVKLLGQISEAKYADNTNVRYMNSTSAEYVDDICYNKDMHENGTPLTAASLGLSYHAGGWFIDLNGNYYDRIYLSYSPSFRYWESLKNRHAVYGDVFDADGNILPGILDQAKGKGGFMLDASIGKSIYLKKGSLSINLTLTNVLNNRDIVTGGYEQSRSDYTQSGNTRTYKFSKNPMKFYAYGTNGMLNITYKF